MTEQKSNDINCACGALIGQVEDVEGVDLLRIGNLIARYVHGVCRQCGREYQWNTNDRMLQRLVRRVMEER